MPGSTRAQRVRDPVHNLIEFNSKHFESTLWRVVQTRPFQRLRRIRHSMRCPNPWPWRLVRRVHAGAVRATLIDDTRSAQRVRDPVHDLIEFDSEPFEQALWQVIQTRPFQRLRRIRQLGFSELVFPGATHTRFAHSIGVFHTARKLMKIVKNKMGDDVDDTQLEVALAASLVHDVGHGMFSHSFEEIGKELKLPMARHEEVSASLIRDSKCLDHWEAVSLMTWRRY